MAYLTRRGRIWDVEPLFAKLDWGAFEDNRKHTAPSPWYSSLLPLPTSLRAPYAMPLAPSS
eukprot:1560165-Rhodomonas_salina.1